MKHFSLAGWLVLTHLVAASAAPVQGWLSWRGPEQTGVSRENNLPDKIDSAKPLWTADYPGQSTAVVGNGKVYIMGYLGDDPDLQEGVACFDAETGKMLWSQRYNDFLSDAIYLRYATSSPVIDPETGNVYMQGSQGILAGFTGDGKSLWMLSMMESYGRLTFPNSRTGSPIVDGDLVITRGITANWGAHGPGGDRYYAFDKKTGELVWSSSPGGQPRDNSFSHAYLGWHEGKRVFYTALGDGSVVCVNARTGDPIWRVPLFRAGINATMLVHNNDKVISIFGTPYEPGQMVALKIPKVPAQSPSTGAVVVARSQVQLWANDLSTSTSSPILVGDRVYVVTEKGDLCAVDANTGEIAWKLKIGIEQRNSCPLFADGKLYVPILDNPGSGQGGEGITAGSKGAFYIIKPGDRSAEILTHAVLDGRCFGSPTAYNGKIYMQTTRKLYCFGTKGNNSGLAKAPQPESWPKAGPATQLQIIPSEITLRPGQTASFRVRKLDANGLAVQDVKDVKAVKWASYIPPTARVKSELRGDFNAEGQLVAGKDSVPSAGAFEATLDNLKGYIRGRVLPYMPLKEDFEMFELTETTTNTVEEATKFGYPPLPWIGARFKFEVREKDGTKTLTKTIDNKFFQRGTVFIGTPEMKNYTIQADVMSEGSRRKMSEVGLINQRYVIVLKGNDQKLEIHSNQERLRIPPATDPPNFKWSPKTWYTLKARVDSNPKGGGVVRAKAWKRGEPEPEKWTLEFEHKTAHQSGSPGLFGFAGQDQPVHIDNISVVANQ